MTRPRTRFPAPICVGALLAALALPMLAAGQSGGLEHGEAVAIGSGRLETTTIVETLQVSSAGDAPTLRQYVPADRIRAGDQVYYTIRVTNPGREAVRDIVVTKRLPFGMQYVRGSAVGPATIVYFSVDSGESFAAAADLSVAIAGQPSRRAGPADYTHVRWVLQRPLPPRATALLRFRATLS